MSKYFKLLEKVLRQPERVYNTGTIQEWDKFECELGIILPDDYKKLINTYGTGGIGNFIWFLTPFSNDDNVNYNKKMTSMLEAYRISKEKFPEYYIYDVYPKQNGILPWGYTDNGDELYWKTGDKTENWEIVIYESASPDYYSYQMGLAEFLYKILTKEIMCEIIPKEIFNADIEYIPVNIK